MKSISIDNEKYVKATDIARELGYTADYVGQLCRAGKVDSQLVGRSWYVSEDSLRGHKKTRYRSTKSASKKAIATSLQTKDMDTKESFSVAVHVDGKKKTLGYGKQNFYSRTASVPEHEYFSDESDLMPLKKETTKKTGRLSVSLADAQKIRIKSSSAEYDFDPTPRPELVFSGSLTISEVEDIQPEDEQIEENKDIVVESVSEITTKEEEILEPKLAPREPVDTATHIKIRHLRKGTKKKSRKGPQEHNDSGIVGMRRNRISARNPSGGTLMVDVPSNNTVGVASGGYMLVVATLASVAICVCLLGLESRIVFDGSSVVTSYVFKIQSLLAAVYFAL